MSHRIHWWVLLLTAFSAVLLIGASWIYTIDTQRFVVGAMATTLTPRATISPAKSLPRLSDPPQAVKGIYLTAYTAANDTRMEDIIALLDRTELNAVVIDIKDYSGYVLYDSQVPLVKELGTAEVRIRDLSAIIERLHNHGIYVIARQTVFQDPILAEKNSTWAIRDSRTGGLWRDRSGLAWVDPTVRNVWEYNLAIAQEAARLGFDEINFDYVRFPSDGAIRYMVFREPVTHKYEVMRAFYETIRDEMQGVPVKTSLDLFGFVMDRGPEDDLNIGQRLVDAVDTVDYICPMMYPSHYPTGYLGLENPALYPEAVLTRGLERSTPVFEGKRATVRPWIQAFNLGAVYDGNMIRRQIDTVEKYTDSGWLLWNAANRYTDAGLRVEDGY